MLYWWFRRDTSRSGARWIDGDIPATGVRRRCDTQVDRQNEYFSPAGTHYPLTRESCAKGIRLPRRRIAPIASFDLAMNLQMSAFVMSDAFQAVASLEIQVLWQEQS
jgi:hypothetical protein